MLVLTVGGFLKGCPVFREVVVSSGDGAEATGAYFAR
jgi:hypothetical protein